VLACRSTYASRTRRLMTSAFSKQKGKGLREGVTSEVTTYFDVIPGKQHEHGNQYRTRFRTV
jgi:hypothetical protein